MSLSERFRQQLETYNIFEEEQEKPSIKETTVPFKPQMKNETLEELAQKAIHEISKTAYCNEYSSTRKEKMVGSYFDAKFKTAENSDLNSGIHAKSEFIKSVLSKIAV